MTEISNRRRLGHVMLDLETMGRGSNAVICSIGAVEFDIETGETGREFFVKVDMQSCLDRGMTVDGPTIEWWLMQSDAACRAIVSTSQAGNKNIAQALYEFKLFIEDLGANTVEIWGNGISFDIIILTEAYHACKLKEPWNFRCERDVRTLVSFAPNVKEHYPSNSNHIQHHPVSDCKFQIEYCTAIWRKINNLRTFMNIHT